MSLTFALTNLIDCGLHRKKIEIFDHYQTNERVKYNCYFHIPFKRNTNSTHSHKSKEKIFFNFFFYDICFMLSHHIPTFLTFERNTMKRKRGAEQKKK